MDQQHQTASKEKTLFCEICCPS